VYLLRKRVQKEIEYEQRYRDYYKLSTSLYTVDLKCDIERVQRICVMSGLSCNPFEIINNKLAVAGVLNI